MASTISRHASGDPAATPVVLHIGLHKTGTRFLQRRVLRPLDGEHLRVNPSPFWPAIRNAVRHPDDPTARGIARDAVQAWRDRWTYGARTVEALKQRFLEIYEDYAETFGPEAVYLFRQEDLQARPEEVYARLAEALGLAELPIDSEGRRENRSYSALAIRLFHPGTNRTMPAPRPRDAGMPARRLRPVLAPLIRLRRLLIQHGFDRLIYRDWDLLAHANMRARIDDHYAEENERIRAIAANVLDHGPGAVPQPTLKLGRSCL